MSLVRFSERNHYPWGGLTMPRPPVYSRVRVGAPGRAWAHASRARGTEGPGPHPGAGTHAAALTGIPALPDWVDPRTLAIAIAAIAAIRLTARALWRDRTPDGIDPYNAAFQRLSRPVRRKPCHTCGRKPPSQSHHLRYGQPLRATDLLPLCKRCHNQVTRAQGRPPWTLLPLRYAHLGVHARHTPARLARRALRILGGR